MPTASFLKYNTQAENVVDRSGKPEERSQMINSENFEKIDHPEFQASQAEEEREFYKRRFDVSKRIFVKFINEVLLR